MPEHGNDSGTDQQRVGLIAAAQAAASWAHARRAQWTSVPLVVAVPEPPAPAAANVAPATAPAVEVAITPAPAAARTTAAAPATTTTTTPRRARAPGAPVVLKWIVRGAIAAALGAVAAIGGPYVWNALRPSERAAGVDPAFVGPVAPSKATGGLRVSSTPAGAEVRVDGKVRGVTPLRLADLTPGSHDVELTSDAGTVRRTVTIAANQIAAIDEAIFAGWITVYSPFELAIVESGRVLRADDRNQIMLPAGPHDLRLTNRALGYDVTRHVEVKPGEATTVQVTPAPSALTVTATEAADVWIDGARVGETPLTAAPVALGTHEIVVKRAAGGERRFSVTIGVKGLALNVDFSKPS